MTALFTNTFSWPVRVYWEDTDAGGIVYYANYLKFMERARSEWLRALGIEQGPLQRDHGLIFVVVDSQTRYLRPARYADLLQVSCEIAEHTRTSLTFRQEVSRSGDADRELLVSGSVRVACLDSTKMRPRALPEALTQLMTPPGGP